MLKKAGIFLIIIAVIFITRIYLINDGFYAISKINMDELDFINEYATYKVKFPETTIIESFELKKDIKSYFFSHDEYLQAVLLVENNIIDELFPEQLRNYDANSTIYLDESTKEKFQFSIWIPRGVVKWFFMETQRDIDFIVMQPEENYTRVYLLVYKLGWNLIS